MTELQKQIIKREIQHATEMASKLIDHFNTATQYGLSTTAERAQEQCEAWQTIALVLSTLLNSLIPADATN